NLTQAQRDFFGSHTYERVDKPELGFVHTEWEELLDKQKIRSLDRSKLGKDAGVV
ncbi:MAG: hypothetical protein M3R67_10840, partial [Acidobacteriota bacterium]|nr:hypothetical protein [Acidobacteriota bacterium]